MCLLPCPPLIRLEKWHGGKNQTNLIKKYVKFNENFRPVSLSPESDQAGVAVLIKEALEATEALHTFIHP